MSLAMHKQIDCKGGRRLRQRGFTYLLLMAIVAITGVMLMASGQVWHTAQQRDKEQELLFVGNQFRQALNGYYEHTPDRAPHYPMKLEDLLKDPRYPSTRRYLRKLYRDPISGSEQWGLVQGANGEIYGIHSMSEETPIKKGNFPLADKHFEGKKRYADWVFMPVPSQRASGNPVQ